VQQSSSSFLFSFLSRALAVEPVYLAGLQYISDLHSSLTDPNIQTNTTREHGNGNGTEISDHVHQHQERCSTFVRSS